jgi:hypothetical protein
MASCGDSSITAPIVTPAIDAPTAPTDPTATTDTTALVITDVEVASVDTAAATIVWSTDRPASGFVEYGTTTSLGSASALEAVRDTAHVVTLSGLTAATTYQYRVRAADSLGSAAISTRGTFTTDPESTTDPVQVSLEGIWVSASELSQIPTSGAAWNALLADAGRSPGTADISDQDSNHDVYTMAAALVCVRTGQYCAKARNGVLDAIGTESGARWLAVGRNLAAYVIAADLLDLRADGVTGSAGTRVEGWIEGWLTKQIRDNNSTTMRDVEPFGGSANAMAQEGLAYTAVAAYLGDEWALERAWDAFRTFACDPSAPDRENIYLDKSVADGWTDASNPCAVNPAGSTMRVPQGMPGAGTVRSIDGSLSGDMRRGGTYQWEPGYTQYTWVGLEGFVPAAVILDRAGYPAFQVADRAVLRSLEYHRYLRTQTGDTRWLDGLRAREIVHLVNVAYDASFPVDQVVGAGRTVGYTGWTHPRP